MDLSSSATGKGAQERSSGRGFRQLLLHSDHHLYLGLMNTYIMDLYKLRVIQNCNTAAIQLHDAITIVLYFYSTVESGPEASHLIQCFFLLVSYGKKCVVFHL